MTSDDCTGSDRRDAVVRQITESAFPLATGPDTPIGPIPLFKVRKLLAEAYRQGVADASANDRGDDRE